MSWQFPKNENPNRWRVEKLILVAQRTVEQLDAEREAMRKRHRDAVALVRMARNKARAEQQSDRIAEFLKTCEQGTTVEQIADACGLSCKHVREAVTQAKREGWIIEGVKHSGLIRVGEITP